jgi:hypothetical protein
MAMEINEIGIRLRVLDREADEGEGRPGREEAGAVDRGEIVEECLRRVLQILNSTRER